MIEFEGGCPVDVQPDSSIVHGRIRHSGVFCRTYTSVRLSDTAVRWLSNSALRRSNTVPRRITNTRPERRLGSDRHQHSGTVERLRRLRLRSESIAGVQSGYSRLSFPWHGYGTRPVHSAYAGYFVRFGPHLLAVSAESQSGWISSFTQSGRICSDT